MIIFAQKDYVMNDKSDRLKIIDELLSKGKPVRFQEFVQLLEKTFHRIENDELSYSDPYGNLFRQDIRTIRTIIKTSANGIDPDMLISEGSKRYTTYRYKVPGFSILPYLEYQYTQADYKKLEKALKILGNNLPTDVFERIEFALRSRIEYDYGSKEKSIDYGENYGLRGRERLPYIYKRINKTPLRITYKTFYDKEETYELHPYLLKQYNNRWFLFGFRPDRQHYYWCVPLDRIENVVENETSVIVPRPASYGNFFDDIIGTTKGKLLKNGDIDRQAEKEKIRIQICDFKTWKRITTKPIHKSQQVVSEYKENCGEIEIQIIPNIEFYYRLISCGEGIRIVQPELVADIMKSIISSLM